MAFYNFALVALSLLLSFDFMITTKCQALRSFCNTCRLSPFLIHWNSDYIGQMQSKIHDRSLYKKHVKLFSSSKQEIATRNENAHVDTSSPPSHYTSNLDEDTLKQKIKNIRVIASDIDGTLLSSKGTLPDYTRQQVLLALQAAKSPLHPLQHMIIATGKSRKGAMDSLGPELEELFSKIPGVFIQGLYCTDANGKVIFEQKLSRDEVLATEKLAIEHNATLICYDGDNFYASWNSDDDFIELLHGRYGEPKAARLEKSESLADYGPGFHKCLLLHDDTDSIRPHLEQLALKHNATVTQSTEKMIELLPSGCSKGRGIAFMCKLLDIDPATQLLAIGDAENDVEMLKLASIGVAVGNAKPPARNAADVILTANNDQGGAGVAVAQFGLQQQ